LNNSGILITNFMVIKRHNLFLRKLVLDAVVFEVDSQALEAF
jgi:hypothetical protein